MMRRFFLSATAAAAFVSTSAIAPTAMAQDEAKPIEYTVKKGETCSSIAASHFGDVRRVDLVHVLNPQLGPTPHHLVAGQVLLLPPKPTPPPPSPDAKLTRVRNHVEVRAPEPRPGKANDPLFRGNRVATKEDSAADVIFRDETEVKLDENTLVVIFGDVHAAATRVDAAEATIVTGALRARLSEIAGKKPKSPRFSTPSGAVVMKDGEAQVSVDAKQATRLAVYAGGSNVTAQKHTTKVSDGFGSKAEMGHIPTPPKPLPATPVWTTTPPALVVVDHDLPDIDAAYAPGQGAGDAAAEWHLQLARDAAFDDVVVDVRVPLGTVALKAQKIPPGSYSARVSAIDADKFEGKWSAPIAFSIARVTLAPLPSRKTRVETADKTLSCTVDGGAAQPFPIDVDRNAAHSLWCTSGAAVGPYPMKALPLGAVHTTAEVVARHGNEGTLRVHVVDDEGEPLERLPVVGLPTAGVVIGAFRPGDAPGIYVAPIQWFPGVLERRFAVRVGGVIATASNTVALEESGAPAPRSATRSELTLGGAFAARAFTQLGVGGFVGLGATRPMGSGVGSISLRGSFAIYPTASVDTDVPGSATTKSRASVTTISVAIPLGYRFGRRESVAPYVLLAPEIGRQSIARDDASPKSSAALTVGGYGALGLDSAAGPGAIFVEAGFHGAAVVGDDRVSVPASAMTLGVGYRLGL